MSRIGDIARGHGLSLGSMTVSECVLVAEEALLSVGEVILLEAEETFKLSRQEVENRLIDNFSYNLRAAEVGCTTGSSFLMGKIGRQLSGEGLPKIFEERLVNKILAYTLAAQIGNHTVGLQPCAGTGDSCSYTGFVKAMLEEVKDLGTIARVAAVILKIGTFFRVAKTTTGCNVEGFGAGAAACAAAFAELSGASAKQVEKAVVLALSPTIAVPCTTRVMVAGLCATHIGGAVMIGKLASYLAVSTDIPVTVPADVMMVMAAQIHPISAKYIVPTVMQYMEPFFEPNPEVENYVSMDVREQKEMECRETLKTAALIAHEIASKADPIIAPFGMAVVGGSSQAVGSPANAARIAHFLSQGKISAVKIELCPELFARRGINIPGILMAALYGVKTDDAEKYCSIMEDVAQKGVKVTLEAVHEAQVQRITIRAKKRDAMVDALNRGGGRLMLRNAYPDRDEAIALAKQLGIVLVD